MKVWLNKRSKTEFKNFFCNKIEIRVNWRVRELPSFSSQVFISKLIPITKEVLTGRPALAFSLWVGFAHPWVTFALFWATFKANFAFSLQGFGLTFCIFLSRGKTRGLCWRIQSNHAWLKPDTDYPCGARGSGSLKLWLNKFKRSLYFGKTLQSGR